MEGMARAKMIGAALLGQNHLLVAFAGRSLLLRRQHRHAIGAANTFFISVGLPLFQRQGCATTRAQMQMAGDFQAMSNGHASVKYETIAMPFALLFRNELKIF